MEFRRDREDRWGTGQIRRIYWPLHVERPQKFIEFSFVDLICKKGDDCLLLVASHLDDESPIPKMKMNGWASIGIEDGNLRFDTYPGKRNEGYGLV